MFFPLLYDTNQSSVWMEIRESAAVELVTKNVLEFIHDSKIDKPVLFGLIFTRLLKKIRITRRSLVI